MKYLFLSFLLLSPAVHALDIEDAFIPPNSTLGTWVVKKTSWSETDEKNFSDFVIAVAKSGCKTVDECIKSPVANKYYSKAEASVYYYADCGRFPYLLRMYFAWKNNLPFSAITETTGTPEDVNAWVQKQIQNGNPNPNPRDNYPTNSSDHGNLMQTRTSIPNSRRSVYDFYYYARFIISRTNSSNYRFEAQVNTPETPDFYPIEISRQAIKPGTVIYDPSGHVMMVYEISADGNIKYVDAHPDNGVSRKTFDNTIRRSRPAHGPGFKNWRPYSFSNVTNTTQGYVGGDVNVIENKLLVDFSTTQFYGTHPDAQSDWTKGIFKIGAQTVDYYEYIQLKLAPDGFKIDPIQQVKRDLDSMCLSFKDRVGDVEKAIHAGLDQQPHPDRMPKNIYADAGDWESYSSPGRDLRSRFAYVEVYNHAKKFAARLKANDSTLLQPQGSYSKILMQLLSDLDRSCIITYRNSVQQEISIKFTDMLKRLSDVSFDPYMCVERRWGAKNSELNSCQEDSDKASWYNAQAYYRRMTEKKMTYDNDFSLNELINKNSVELSQTSPLNYDLMTLFSQLGI